MMILIYAYTEKYKNYERQEISFDSSYTVNFNDGVLKITYNGPSKYQDLYLGSKLDNLHIVVGKTGSGKTNLLQLIGSKNDTRTSRMWKGEPDAYFLLYKENSTEFFLEICNIEIKQFPAKNYPIDKSIPKDLIDNLNSLRTLNTVHFALTHELKTGDTVHDFHIIQKDRNKLKENNHADKIATIINCYDIHSFMESPYEDNKEMGDDFSTDWIGRINAPYHRTSLWGICDYIRDYLESVESGSLKKETSFVLSTHNFADDFLVELPKNVEEEYWTFCSLERDKRNAPLDKEAIDRLKKRSKQAEKLTSLTKKNLFIHDLWTDYALYLRKWAERIDQVNSKYTSDYDDEYVANQEFLDYYFEKDNKEDIDSTILPDGISMSIVKRCTWLAEYIDRIDNGNAHGILWQIIDDIKDICNFLSILDDKYFTIDTCTIPIVDMGLPKYKHLFEDLFERMEQYIPDDGGIFTKYLLPYRFTHLSTGEYQYAKVLGGIKEYLTMYFNNYEMIDKIILLDEPEAYMHPELARQFIKRMHDIVEKHKSRGSVQIIIGTHSPFIVSDVFADNITRLTIDPKSGNAIVLNKSEKEYFGANLHSIFADSFFLDYTIGEYSRCWLQNSLNYLQSLEKKEPLLEEDLRFIDMLKPLLKHIGDPVIRKAFDICLNSLENRYD